MPLEAERDRLRSLLDAKWAAGSVIVASATQQSAPSWLRIQTSRSTRPWPDSCRYTRVTVALPVMWSPAQIAALPVHREKAELWRRLNDLESVRPMVWINEIPWHEMNVNDELTLRFQPQVTATTGAIAGAVFVWAFNFQQNRMRIDDVLGVWPLHGLCGAWGGIAAGIF